MSFIGNFAMVSTTKLTQKLSLQQILQIGRTFGEFSMYRLSKSFRIDYSYVFAGD